MESTPLLTPTEERASGASPVERAPASRSRARVWLATAALTAALYGIVQWTDGPPSPVPASAPATEFSEARARPVMEHLTRDIGKRVMGTPQRDAAQAYLVATLRGIRGVEVAPQDWAGTVPALRAPASMEMYRVRNVLARIPGDSASAVLVSAHYDSPPESVGAADDGVAVAAAVEMVRALAAGPRPKHTVIFNFSDGEEAGLYGSRAFLDSPWARDVRTFVNLEAAGAAGKAVLFQAGPGNAWLTEAYARSVPRPYGTVLGQDIFQSGLIPSDTDFRVYRTLGKLRGLDVAMYQDGWAYHTGLDRPERVTQGSIQHMGENTLALVRELANGPLPGDVGGAPAIYYDFLGRTMFAYTAGTATLLALVAILLAIGGLVLAVRRTPLRTGRIFGGLGITVLAGVAAIVLPIVGALLLSLGLGRAHGWFASPWLAWTAFGSLALAGFFFVHSWWARRNGGEAGADDTALAALAGSTLVWVLMLALFTALGLGSAYLPLWWTLAGAAGLAIWSLAPRHRWVALAVAWVLPAVLTMQVHVLLLKLFIPVAGRFPAPFPFDPVIALLVALPTVWLASAGVAALHRVGGVRTVALAFGVVGVIGLAALAFTSPYTSARPKRIAVQQRLKDGKWDMVVMGEDWPNLASALRGVSGEHFRRGGPTPLMATRPSEPAPLPPLSLHVVGSTTDAAGVRTVRLHIAPGSYRFVQMRIPSDRLVGWSLADGFPAPGGPGLFYGVRAYEPPPAGWFITLRIRGAEPMPVDVSELFDPAETAATRKLMHELPSWTIPASSVQRRQSVDM